MLGCVLPLPGGYWERVKPHQARFLVLVYTVALAVWDFSDLIK